MNKKFNHKKVLSVLLNENMYFSNRITTISKMKKNNNTYLFKTQRFNFEDNFAQSGNKSQWVVVLP